MERSNHKVKDTSFPPVGLLSPNGIGHFKGQIKGENKMLGQIIWRQRSPQYGLNAGVTPMHMLKLWFPMERYMEVSPLGSNWLCIRSSGWSSHDGLCALRREGRDPGILSLPFEDTARGHQSQPGSRSSSGTKSASNLILPFLTSRTEKEMCVLYATQSVIAQAN